MLGGIVGAEAMIARLAHYDKRVEEAARRGLLAGALDVLGDAQRNAPVATGNLKASGYVFGEGARATNPSWNPEGNTSKLSSAYAKSKAKANAIVATAWVPTVIVAFGAYYSVFVHELHRTRGQFLRKALRNNFDRIRDRVAAAIEKAKG